MEKTIRATTIKYGIWEAEVVIEPAGERKRLAQISAVAGHGASTIKSRHTVVFDHEPGSDESKEIEGLVKRILANSH